jgi:hypothetical protein
LYVSSCLSVEVTLKMLYLSGVCLFLSFHAGADKKLEWSGKWKKKLNEK